MMQKKTEKRERENISWCEHRREFEETQLFRSRGVQNAE